VQRYIKLKVISKLYGYFFDVFRASGQNAGKAESVPLILKKVLRKPFGEAS
jgi:hypothetical protein